MRLFMVSCLQVANYGSHVVLPFSCARSDLLASHPACRRPHLQYFKMEAATPSAHLVHSTQMPYLEASPKPRRCCRICLCQTCIILLSILVGIASTAACFVMLDPHDVNVTATAPTTCPGVCASRMLHGSFATNVSRSKVVGPVTVVVRFLVVHSFDWPSRTAALLVDPIDMQPHWLPDVLHRIHCTNVPFELGDACNISLSNECTRSSFQANDVKAFTLLWDPEQDAIDARETVATPFFTQTFVWREERQ